MPQEPERPIEKILRDSARERREQARDSWELHPANRRLLQKEVARKFQKGQKADKRGMLNWISLYWRVTTLAGVAVLALLLGAVWLVAPQHGTGNNATLLARNEQPPVPALNDKLSSREQEAVDEKERSQSSDARKVTKKEEAPTLTRRDSPEKDLALDSAQALQKAKPAEIWRQPGADRGIAPALAAADSGSPAPAASADSFRQRYGLSGGAQPQAAQSSAAAPVASPLRSARPQQIAPPEPQVFSATVGQSTPAALSTSPASTSTASVSGAIEIKVVQYGYFAGRQMLGRQTEESSRANRIAPSGSSNKNADVAERVAPAPVLAYFHIEQAGPELRVIDSDGSIYSGSLQAAAAAPPGLSSGAEELSTASRAFSGAKQQDNLARSAAPKRAQTYTEAAGYSFQVVGTNRTSRQRVAFSGTITGLSNTVSSVQLRNEPLTVLDAEQTRVAAKSSTTQLSETLSAPDAHVSGKAIIGPDQQVNIEATAAAPPR